VIIPAWNGHATIADCLQSVRRASQSWNVEILIVESSGDAARDIVRAQFPEVRLIIPAGRLQVGAARNLGLTHATGELAFFVDQDCTVPENWFDRVVPFFKDSAVGAVGGSLGVRNPRNWSGMGVYFLEFFRHIPENREAADCVGFLLGCNLAVRRTLFPQVQFPEQTLGEDVMYSNAVRMAGFRLLYAPQISAKHWNRTGWDEFFRYNGKMGAAAAGYHGKLRSPVVRPFLYFPPLILLTPPFNLLHVLMRLARARSGLLPLFLLLSPICLMGNIWWAIAFCWQLCFRQHRNVATSATASQQPE
jgi:GT2 family glycosyltransferase